MHPPKRALALLLLMLMGCPKSQANPEIKASPHTAASQEAALIREIEKMADHPPSEKAAWWRTRIGESTSPTLWHAAGRLHAAAKEWPEAEAAFTRALSLAPAQRETEIELAATYTAQQTPRLAIKLLSARMSDATLPARAFLVYGQALLDAGDPFTADAAFRQALLRDPSDLSARRGLARALHDQARWPELLRWCALRLKESPKDRLALAWNMDALIGLGQWAQAEERVPSTKAAGAFSRLHQKALAEKALSEQRTDAVLRLWDRQFPTVPDDASHMIQTGLQLVEAGKPRSAAGIEARLNSLLPTQHTTLRADIHLLSASIALATGEPERALQETTRGLELIPNHPKLITLRERLAAPP